MQLNPDGVQLTSVFKGIPWYLANNDLTNLNIVIIVVVFPLPQITELSSCVDV